jgi:hypothetical protein
MAVGRAADIGAAEVAKARAVAAEDCLKAARLEGALDADRAAVRKTPGWPRSWANFSLSQLYSHGNAWANLHILGQPNTRLARGRGGGCARVQRLSNRGGGGGGRKRSAGGLV